jgi:peptidoglycan hydrolase-like protein with peptidoglycan-binding domain
MAKVYSQNGYEANNRSLIASFTIPGTKVRIALRKGHASVILLDLLAWFNENIQPLRQKDTGGYAERTIRGSSKTLSNHASGTATDTRWQDHPLGAEDTFTNDQEARIQARLKFYEGAVRWGGNYKGRKDEMHFEIVAGPAELARIARKVQNPPVPKPGYPNVPVHVTARHDVRLGHRGTDVVDIQRKVGATPDGEYGPDTENRVKGFQRKNKLTADGIVGDKTWRKLGFTPS